MIKNNELKSLTSEEFINIWRGNLVENEKYKQYYIKGKQDNDLFINDPYHERVDLAVVIFHVKIIGDIYLFEDFAYLPINISECTFDGYFSISKGQFAHILIGRHRENVVFKKGLFINGGTFNKSVNLYMLNFQKASDELQITGGSFNSILRIWHANNINLTVREGLFSEGISLGGIFANIEFSGGEFHADLDLASIVCLGNFQFLAGPTGRKVSENGDFTYDDYSNSLNFVKGGIRKKSTIVVLKHFFISELKCEYLDFSLSQPSTAFLTFINQFTISGVIADIMIETNDQERFLVNTLTLENITLSSTKTFRAGNLEINSINFNNLLCHGRLFINNIKRSGEMTIDPNIFLSEKGEIYFAKIKENLRDKIKKSKIDIINTDFGNSTILNCDFSNFIITFESSKMDTLFVSGTSFPDSILSKGSDPRHQLKLGYNQLKKVFEKNDWERSQFYAIKELETHRDYLNFNSGSKGDRFILWANKWTSNYNTDWPLAIQRILFINTFSFALLVMSFRLPLELTLNGLINILSLLPYLLNYINPIHKSDFLNSIPIANGRWNPLSELIDGLTRIVNAYLLYQLIQSSRKFFKFK